jgi:predicted enzyme related to lactoylglutathione lyase
MSDPFDALRAPVSPVRPSPVFTARLRARLQRALLGPEGEVMTEPTSAAARAGATAAPASDAPLHTLVSYIGVHDAPRALDWYTEVLGARRRGDPVVMGDGRIGHAELALGDSVLMLTEHSPGGGLVSPEGQRGHSHSLMLHVADVDGTVRQAVDHGAELTRPPADYPYGRNAVIVDPFGHRWMISSAAAGTKTADAGPAVTGTADTSAGGTGAEGTAAEGAGQETPGHGDVSYITHEVPDSQRARDFYGAVLGWRFSPGSVEDGWQVGGTTPMAGLAGGREHAAVVLCYQVDDIHAAVRRVREYGGHAEEPSRRPYGLLADCADNQGTRFYLAQ